MSAKRNVNINLYEVSENHLNAFIAAVGLPLVSKAPSE